MKIAEHLKTILLTTVQMQTATLLADIRQLQEYDQSFEAKQNNLYVNTGYDEDVNDFHESCNTYVKNNTKILKALLSNLIVQQEKIKRNEPLNKSGLNYVIENGTYRYDETKVENQKAPTVEKYY